MADSVEAFKVYGWEEIHNMTMPELYNELLKWRDFDSLSIAMGFPSALKGLVVKIAELRRENAILRGKLNPGVCELCQGTHTIQGEFDKGYSVKACPRCGPVPVRMDER